MLFVLAILRDGSTDFYEFLNVFLVDMIINKCYSTRPKIFNRESG